MQITRIVAFWTVTMVLTAAAAAQQTAPTDAQPPAQPPAPQQQEAQPPAPEPAPAPVPVDTTTPRGALKTLSTAINDGDTETLRRVMHADTEAEKAMVDSLVTRVRSLSQLRAAAQKQFGEEGAEAMFGDTQQELQASHEMVDRSVEQVEGDQATVDAAAAGEEPLRPIRLVRMDGQWKIQVSALAPNVSPEQVNELKEDAQVFATVFDQMSRDIQAGKFESPDDASNELQTRMMRAAFEQQTRRAEQDPADAPASPPSPDQTQQGEKTE